VRPHFQSSLSPFPNSDSYSVGAEISAPGAPSKLRLLPGQYGSDTSPQLLHDILTSSSASLSPSPGFNDSFSLPLNLALQPGFSIFSNPLYAGESDYTSLPSTRFNFSTPLTGQSLTLSPNVWISTISGANRRTVIWESVPDFRQLPQGTNITLVDMQSSACSPPCSGSGVCSASGICQCPRGFTGSACESCADGFFGPTCQACPDGCPSCDDGIAGSGRCLQPVVRNAPSTCNCVNGVCGNNGQCQCNAGFTRGDDGSACSKCSQGFFLTSTGDCKGTLTTFKSFSFTEKKNPP
jgi:hypothetical protein